MSGSNRGNRTETVALTAFCSIAVLGICALLYVLGLLNGRQAERRQQAPASYSEAAKADAQRACVGGEPSAVFECVYERVESGDQSARADQDLTAQQRAADSALASAVVSLLTLFISGIGVWFVKRTLEATLEAVEDTGNATKAMVRQNEIAEAAQRAWVSIDVAISDASVNSGMEGALILSFKNIGQTVAHQLDMRVTGAADWVEEYQRVLSNLNCDGPHESGVSVIPGDVYNWSHALGFPPGEGKWKHGKPHRHLDAAIIAKVSYKTDFSNDWKHTLVVFIPSIRGFGPGIPDCCIGAVEPADVIIEKRAYQAT